MTPVNKEAVMLMTSENLASEEYGRSGDSGGELAGESSSSVCSATLLSSQPVLFLFMHSAPPIFIAIFDSFTASTICPSPNLMTRCTKSHSAAVHLHESAASSNLAPEAASAVDLAATIIRTTE